MVFQSYALYPHMTVQENMGFALRMSGWKKSDIEQEVKGAADKLKLTHLLHRYPKQLSGGQRQRVAIGRAIVRRPSVFLFDEPLSNLDAALRVEMRIELAKLHKELGTTMIYVTHDQTEAMTLGDRIAVFNQGRIGQLGKPLDLYHRPANRFVAEFLGSPKINILPVQALGFDAVQLTGAHELPLSCLAYDQTQLHKVAAVGVRAELWDLLGHDANGIKGRVDFVEHLGDIMIAHIKVSGLDTLLTVKTPAVLLQVGQAVVLRPQTTKALAFDTDGRIL
jgi:multiple sugar transport system ATP-binding protein